MCACDDSAFDSSKDAKRIKNIKHAHHYAVSVTEYDVMIGLDDDGDLSARKTTAKQATVKKA
jgi:hypothetical protein